MVDVERLAAEFRFDVRFSLINSKHVLIIVLVGKGSVVNIQSNPISAIQRDKLLSVGDGLSAQ